MAGVTVHLEGAAGPDMAVVVDRGRFAGYFLAVETQSGTGGSWWRNCRISIGYCS